MKEEELIKQWFQEARLGSKLCFDNLLTYYHAQLLSYAMKICKFNTIAEDALQEAYINAYLHFNEVREPAKFLAWLTTIVKRSCWQHIKYSENHLPLSAKLIDSKIADYDLENDIEKDNLKEFVHSKINLLSDTLKVVVILRYFTVYNDYKSISEILGIPVGTVRSRLNEAKIQLKKIWHRSVNDLPENIRTESLYWNDFYFTSFNNYFFEPDARFRLIEHILPDANILFTSGKTAVGREPIEDEFNNDVKYGSRFETQSVFNLKDIGIVQGKNINSSEYPDRCPPTSTLIFKRINAKAAFVQIHNESRTHSAALKVESVV